MLKSKPISSGMCFLNRKNTLFGYLCPVRHNSSVIVRPPSSSAPRESPVPLVFVSAKGWYGKETKVGIQTCAAMLREQGFTTLDIELDITIPARKTILSSKEILGLYAKELNWQIRACNIWPPVVVARSTSTLIAQAYIESYPATGMALIGAQTLMPTPIHPPAALKKPYGTSLSFPDNATNLFIPPQFTYEPHFPILLVETKKYNIGKMPQNGAMQRESYLALEVGVEIIKEEKEDGHDREMYEKVSTWLQNIGV